MKIQADVRNKLEANDIDYIVNSNGNSMRDIGSSPVAIDRFGKNINSGCEYRIYVNKKDYDRAIASLR